MRTKQIGKIEIKHDMQHPFTFLNDDPKHDGATWLVKIYIFGIALVKHSHKKYYRVVRFRNVNAALLPIFKYEVDTMDIFEDRIIMKGAQMPTNLAYDKTTS